MARGARRTRGEGKPGRDGNGRGLGASMVRGVHFAVEVASEVGKLVARGDGCRPRVGRTCHADRRAASTASESDQRACRTFVRATFAVPTPRPVRPIGSSQSYRGEHRWHVCSESSEIARTSRRGFSRSNPKRCVRGRRATRLAGAWASIKAARCSSGAARSTSDRSSTWRASRLTCGPTCSSATFGTRPWARSGRRTPTRSATANGSLRRPEPCHDFEQVRERLVGERPRIPPQRYPRRDGRRSCLSRLPFVPARRRAPERRVGRAVARPRGPALEPGRGRRHHRRGRVPGPAS